VIGLERNQMKLSTSPRSLPQQQRGAVLLMALIFLIILSLLGVTAMNGTMIETKLAANYVEKNYALQITEAGLTQLENMLNTPAQLDILAGNGAVDGTASIVDRGNGLNACVANVRAEGKGRFAPPRTSNLRGINSIAQNGGVDMVYFEINSLGTAAISGTTCDNTATGKVQTHLRSGVRQLAPKAQ
jgi:Tfp pilus assembly protein PilX